MVVHQIVPVFTLGDATGGSAVAYRAQLRRLGHWGEVYAADVAASHHSLVKPLSSLKVASTDLVLYHHGIASPLAGLLMHLPCRRGVVYHNITPARFFAGTAMQEPLIAGRAQLAALADFVELSLADSHFNASELRIAGHRNVHTVPLFVEPQRFDAERADPAMKRRLKSASVLVVSVSRVLPHKRMEDLLSLHAELLRITPAARLVIVGGYDPGRESFRKLQQRAVELGGVQFLGKVSHAELVAAYRSADVFVSMSEHEGFGVPLVEAMASDVPVLAFGAAAVPETMGGRGVVFDEKHFAALAELVMQIKGDPAMRGRIVEGQRARLDELSAQSSLVALREALETVAPDVVPAPRHRKKSRPKVALVVQRYGEKISGGAEAYARHVAHHLAPHAHVTVLTTAASDHLTWQDTMPLGDSVDGPIAVKRFSAGRARVMSSFNRLGDELYGRGNDLVSEEHWLAEQGPVAPALLRHLAEVRTDYDAFIFFTYLYVPTAWGLPLVADRALVVPTTHDEPPLQFDAFDDVYELPQAVLCLTPEEQQLVEQRFPRAARRRVVGTGIDVPAKLNPARFAERHHLRGPYLLYVGRLEAGKGVKALLKAHRALVDGFHDAPTLVLAGAGDLKVSGDRVRVLGRISEEDKFDGLAGAVAAVSPSAFESLSLLTLEAMAVGTPVVGNAQSLVVAGHIERSGAGASFTTPEQYAEAVRQVGRQPRCDVDARESLRASLPLAESRRGVSRRDRTPSPLAASRRPQGASNAHVTLSGAVRRSRMCDRRDAGADPRSWSFDFA